MQYILSSSTVNNNSDLKCADLECNDVKCTNLDVQGDLTVGGEINLTNYEYLNMTLLPASSLTTATVVAGGVWQPSLAAAGYQVVNTDPTKIVVDSVNAYIVVEVGGVYLVEASGVFSYTGTPSANIEFQLGLTLADVVPIAFPDSVNQDYGVIAEDTPLNFKISALMTCTATKKYIRFNVLPTVQALTNPTITAFNISLRRV